jgi:hypothetical protein
MNGSLLQPAGAVAAGTIVSGNITFASLPWVTCHGVPPASTSLGRARRARMLADLWPASVHSSREELCAQVDRVEAKIERFI